MDKARAQSAPTTIRKIHDRAAGIDVGAEEHWVCVDAALTSEPIRRFAAFTEDLMALVTWLTSVGVTTVAMEATGVYWRELYIRLAEAGIEVLLADPRKTRNPRGRKTDMQDCQWIWELHAHGLLEGAFVPGPLVQQLRTYMRFRQARTADAAVSLTEMQRALSLMNIKLQHVLADVGGITGMAIIKAILDGERDPHVLARLRDWRCKADEKLLAKALTGTWRSEHIFLLRHAYLDYEHHRQAMAVCDQTIEALIASFPARATETLPLTPKRATARNSFSFDAQQAAYRLTGVDLAAVDGIGPKTALDFLGEVGFDLSAWPSRKAFCNWLGLAPNPKRSGGKHLGNLPTTANRAAQILRNAAMGLDGKDKTNPLSAIFRRIASRKGRAEAIKATAHKLARIIYAMFRDRTTYDATKLTPPLTERRKKHLLRHLSQQAARIGYTLQLAPAALPETAG
jgi:transposase